MRNLARVLAFDVVAPLAAIAALVVIGVMLGWPLWWASSSMSFCSSVIR